MSAERLKVVICWHMHQPDYRDHATGRYELPWTYLHAIKDYVDMAGHLEAVPQAKVVINFAPTLLDQLADYADQVQAFFVAERPIGDSLLAALGAISLPRGEERLALIDAALRANETRLINRFAPYRALCDLIASVAPDAQTVDYLSDEFVSDLLVWYHLAWMGETVRRQNGFVQALMKQGTAFSLLQRRALLRLIGELIASVVPRYRALSRRGQVELSTSPMGHPILPLLMDFDVASESMPGVVLPETPAYPDGETRARWHLSNGLRIFAEHFGFSPSGCWPSEGGVSDATLRLLDEHGIAWAATGEAVLNNSLARVGSEAGVSTHHRPYRIEGQGPACFFRCDELSDDIGFNFSTWHADDAVGHLVHRLMQIREASASPAEDVVSIVLDGENAWEFYPENAYHFLSGLFETLAHHPDLEMMTFSDALAAQVSVGDLPGLVAGSWVYGTFSTWIGHAAKNRAWELLIAAKQVFNDRIDRLTAAQRTAAYEQLAVCEGSDWFWWLGDDNPRESVESFDRLFRQHLSHLYRLLKTEVPEVLHEAISHGGEHAEQGGVMRRGSG